MIPTRISAKMRAYFSGLLMSVHAKAIPVPSGFFCGRLQNPAPQGLPEHP
jgi:hypothetical protein